jgi:hypothetical protein
MPADLGFLLLEHNARFSSVEFDPQHKDRDFMYLVQLTIKNFRKLRDAKLKFRPKLNVLVSPKNVGKGAVP